MAITYAKGVPKKTFGDPLVPTNTNPELTEHLLERKKSSAKKNWGPNSSCSLKHGKKIQWFNFRNIYQATPLARIDLIRNGVNAEDFKIFVNCLDIQQEKVFFMLGISTATVNRKASRKESLSTEDSEKIVGMAKLIGQVETMLDESGDQELMKNFNAANWLTHWIEEPIPALGGASPSQFMDTIEGQEMISKLLGTMQTGAYA